MIDFIAGFVIGGGMVALVAWMFLEKLAKLKKKH